MSIWSDIRKRADGKSIRKEDNIPIHLLKSSDYISKKFYQIKYLGRIEAHSGNPFYPKGLGEFYQVVTEGGVTINGINLQQGATIIGFNDSHWNYDYYLYSEKSPIIK